MNQAQPQKPTSHHLNLRIAFWNARGLRNKKLLLADFLLKNDTDVILVNETHLQPGQSFFINSYRTLRTDRTIKKGGGTAILVKSSISHTLNNSITNQIENTSININTTTGPIKLIAAYCPPKDVITLQDLTALFSDDIPTLLAGDLNAKHKNWLARATNPKGRALSKHARSLNLDINAPTSHTFFPLSRREKSDILDIALSRNLPYLLQLTVGPDLGSDHCVVHADLSIPSCNTLTDLPPKNLINWKGYNRTLKRKTPDTPTPNNIGEVDDQVDLLTNLISSALDKNSRPAPVKSDRVNIPPEILELLQKKRLARKLWRQTGYRPYKSLYNRLNTKIKVLNRVYYEEKWKEKLASLSTQDNSLWDLLRLLNKKKTHIPPLTEPTTNAIINSNPQKARLFASHTAQVHNPDIKNIPLKHLEHVSSYVANYFSRALPPQTVPFTLDELTEIIQSANPKKAPGPDGIPIKALQHLPDRTLKFLYSTLISSYRFGHFPTKWKTAHTIMIPKPGKNQRSPSSYRPISLLNALSKTYEKLLLQIMHRHIENHDLIIKQQAGFTAQTSTIHQAARLTNFITEGFHRRKITSVVFLDIERAFDRVWHLGLLYKLIRYDFSPHIIHSLKSYLTDRTFKIKIANSLSPRERILAGVPQGSVLSPTLFKLYINDLPPHPNTNLFLYADDTAIAAQNHRFSVTRKYLQGHLGSLELWFQNWNLRINGAKSAAVIFLRDRKYSKNVPPLHISGEDIPWSKSTKYLGLTLDSSLSWSRHIPPRLKLARRLVSRIYPLLRVKSTIGIPNALTLYKSVIRPFLIYGHQIWSHCSQSNLNSLDTFQSGILRLILDYTHIPTKYILSDLNIPPLSDYITASTHSFFESLKNHPNPLYNAVSLSKPPQLLRPLGRGTNIKSKKVKKKKTKTIISKKKKKTKTNTMTLMVKKDIPNKNKKIKVKIKKKD